MAAVTHRELRSDCARCCGLCCTGPAFDSSQGFGYDKPAHRPCRHLDLDHRCGIHADREAHGFIGCIGFECFGAGQWVAQRFGGGQGWRSSPEQAAMLFAAYRRFLVLHELLAMIDVAQRAQPRDPAIVAQLHEEVAQVCETEERSPGAQDLPALRARVIAVLGEQLTRPSAPADQVPQKVCSTRSPAAGGCS